MLFRSWTTVYLYNASTGFQAGRSSIRPGASQSGFAIVGVTDGEYEIVARRAMVENEYSTSPPRRITVKGGDLKGIELRVAPAAMVSGKVVEASPKICDGDSKSLPGDITVSASRATNAPPALGLGPISMAARRLTEANSQYTVLIRTSISSSRDCLMKTGTSNQSTPRPRRREEPDPWRAMTRDATD